MPSSAGSAVGATTNSAATSSVLIVFISSALLQSYARKCDSTPYKCVFDFRNCRKPPEIHWGCELTYSDGRQPNFFLKLVEKYEGELKPTS